MNGYVSNIDFHNNLLKKAGFNEKSISFQGSNKKPEVPE